ncbi:MAG TPA: hypothetical protein PLG31_14275 [Spirochaetota bacterium]|nr:hypothetical protein [Spirochaetota bacterium]
MTLDSEARNSLVRHKLEKADSIRDEVAFLIENGRLATAVDRVYYGMFYAVSALAPGRFAPFHALFAPRDAPLVPRSLTPGEFVR